SPTAHYRHAPRHRLPQAPGGRTGQTSPPHRNRTSEAIMKPHVQAKINGKHTEFLCEARQSLLEVLRDVLQLTGTKEGCNNGNCGSCNVLLDGRLVNSCLVMAPEVSGRSVSTIEGVATPEGLHPLQQKFLENAALQ